MQIRVTIDDSFVMYSVYCILWKLQSKFDKLKRITSLGI